MPKVYPLLPKNVFASEKNAVIKRKKRKKLSSKYCCKFWLGCKLGCRLSERKYNFITDLFLNAHSIDNQCKNIVKPILNERTIYKISGKVFQSQTMREISYQVKDFSLKPRLYLLLQTRIILITFCT